MSGTYIPLSDEHRATILTALREGHSRKDAAQLAGVSYWKLRDWLLEERHSDFKREVLAAETESTGVLIGMVKLHAAQDWRAAAWLLERRSRQWQSPADKLKARELAQPKQPIAVLLAQQQAVAAEFSRWEPLELPGHAEDASGGILGEGDGYDEPDDEDE